MNTCSDNLNPEETEVLREALSDGTRRAGPCPEYAAELRFRLLRAATATKTVREKSSRPILLGSILGTAIAVGLLVLAWSFAGEPAWAAAIRKAREQAWIRAQVEQGGVSKGQLWVSPDRDIVAAQLGETDFIFDYKHGAFSRYDARHNLLRRAFEPEDPGLAHELSSVADVAAVFRRSPIAAKLLPNERIERWRLQSQVIDGVPCDEYEIVIQTASRGLTTLSLAIDRQAFLPRVLTVNESQGRTTTLRFDYPSNGPTDERSVGIPETAMVVDVDRSHKVTPIAESLREGRENFDDYTALCVTSSSADSGGLANCDVRRLSRLGTKWRYDKVRISNRELSLPSDPTQGLKAWQAMRDRFRYERAFVCDGHVIRKYEPPGSQTSAYRTVSLKDEVQADTFVNPLLVPQRCCRPIFATGDLDRTFTPSKMAGGNRELLKVEVSLSPNTGGKETASETYWLDPSRGNVVVREVIHAVRPGAVPGVEAPSSAEEIQFQDFRCSPNGFWYPTLIIRDGADKATMRTTRLYVDFTDVPSDELFRASN
jgi:hypothetical protein